MTRDEVYKELYEMIETLLSIEEGNPYEATLLSYISSYDEATFPLIVLSQLDYSLFSETLNRKEKSHRVSIEANVFAINTATVSKTTIAEYYADMLEEEIDAFGFRLDVSEVIPNLQEDVYRIVLRFSGVVYDDTKVIYRE